MKWIIRIGVIMFAVFCGIKAVPEEKVSSGDITSTSIRYVALGDSIAYGYGLMIFQGSPNTWKALFLKKIDFCVRFF